MKRRFILFKGLALLLAFLMLPLQYSTAESPELVQIDTLDLFDDTSSYIELLSDQEGYYIALVEAARFAGFASG